MSDKQVNIKPLRCQRCSHKWEYSGQNPYFTLCPHCRTTVRIKKKQDRKVVQSAQVGAHVQTDMTRTDGILKSGYQPT